MLTFFTVLFALLLGLVVGVLGGVVSTIALALRDKSLREYFEKEAFDNDPVVEEEEL